MATLLPVAHPAAKKPEKRERRKRRRRKDIGGGDDSKSHGRPLLVTLRIEILRRGLLRVLLLASILATSFRLLHVYRTSLLSTAMTAAVLLRLKSVTSQPEPRERTDPTTQDIPRLTVGIATVPREEKYLLATLDSWLRQLPVDPNDPLHDSVRIVVMNATPDQKHQWFNRARARYSYPHPMSSYVTFVDSRDRDAAPMVEDPKPGVMDEGDANVPGYRVRKQTRDIVALMRHSAVTGRNVTITAGEGDGSGYFLFSEDDMELCDHGLSAIRHALSKSERRFRGNHGKLLDGGLGDGDGDGDGESFVALRVSFGMNGILLHHHHRGPGTRWGGESDDVKNLANYLEEHQVRRPPDHLAVEWFAGETDQSSTHKRGRVNAAFRYNLFNHLGLSSTLRTEKSNAAHFPGCYEELGEPTLFEVESFDFESCPPDEDLWPCPAATTEAAIPHTDRERGEVEVNEDEFDGGARGANDRLEEEAIPTIAWGRLCTSGKRCLNVKNPARRRREVTKAVAAAKTTKGKTTERSTKKVLRKKHPPASLVAAVAKYRT